MKRINAEKVVDMDIDRCSTFHDLTEQMYRSGGFTARKVGEAVRIVRKMISSHAYIFLSFPADIVSTGTRGVLLKLIRDKTVSAVITTCGTLDHDLARIWKDYYHGSFEMDDVELKKRGIHRLGNILIPEGSYGPIIEEKMQKFLEEIYSEGVRKPSTAELLKRLGEFAGSRQSLLYWSSRNSIPVFVPGITDGAVGSQLWMFWQRHRDFNVDLLKDEHMLSDIVFSAKKTGAIMIGGGISKHHTIWWNQFRGGLDYAVYLTTANEFDGSLSGAQTREAISWGKLRTDAKHVTVEGDATITLPLIVAAALRGR